MGELPTSPEIAAQEKDKGHLMQAGDSPETVSLFYNHVYDVNNLCSYNVNSLAVSAIRTQGSIINVVHSREQRR